MGYIVTNWQGGTGNRPLQREGQVSPCQRPCEQLKKRISYDYTVGL